MTPDTAKKVMGYAQTIALHAADVCKEDRNSINNQVLLSSLMLATCFMARFFNEDKAVMHNLLEVLLVAADELPVDEEPTIQ